MRGLSRTWRGPFRVVYVVYPKGLRTGGPEALHQLVDTLRALGQDAYLVPSRATRKNERVATYSRYDAPEVEYFLDAPDVALVVPETLLYEAERIRQSQLFVWWLSIDNSPICAGPVRWRDRRSGLSSEAYSTVLAEVGRAYLRRFKYRRTISIARHLTQSDYAHTYLRTRLGIHGQMLSDYTPPPIASPKANSPRVGGGDSATPVVAYNPAKGRQVTELVRSELPQLRWLPLENMSPEEVQRSLERAHIYLDLGHHPGKDRMPREAARAGAVVIVADRGAGASRVDMPIPDMLRVPASRETVSAAISTVSQVLDDLDTWQSQLAPYRSIIAAEKEKFESEVRSAFLDASEWH